MNFIKFKWFLGLFVCLLSLANVDLYADQAKFKIEVITPGANHRTVAGSIVFVQYRVTNTTALTRTLVRVPQQYVAQDPLCKDSPALAPNACKDIFVLQPGQSCNMCLQFFSFNTGGPGRFTGGPNVCKIAGDYRSPDPLFCSQPLSSDQLDITVTE